MTVIADAKSRLTLGRRIKPGQVFRVEGTADELRLIRLEKQTKKRTRNGVQLLPRRRSRTRNGIPLSSSARPITREDVNAYLYDQD